MRAQAALLTMGVAQGAIVARWLGTRGKGELAVAFLVAAVFQMILNPGFSASYVYFSGSARLRIHDLTRNAMAVTLLAGGAGLAIAAALDVTGALRQIIPHIPLGLVLLAVATMPPTMMVGLLAAILQGQQRIHLANRVLVLDGAVSLAVGLALLIGAGVGAPAIIVGNAAGDVIAATVLAVLLRRDGACFRPAIDTGHCRQLLGYGLRAQSGNLVQFFNYRLDQLLLNALAGPSAVGTYGVSVRLSELLWQVPNAASSVLFAKGANERAEGMDLFTPRVARWTLAVSLAGGLCLAAVGHPLIQAVYSSAFLGAYIPLLWLLPGTVAFGVTNVLAHDLAGRGRPEFNALVAAASLVLTIPLDVILIPSLGATGAAIASSISYAASTLLTLLAYARVTRMLHGKTASQSPAGS